MWGSQNWGELVWGGAAVPTLPLGMLLLLMGCCFLAGGYFLRPGRRGPRSAVAAALLFLVPLSVAAVTLPYAFVNGTVADATQVNANFAALASASDVESCPSGMTRIARAHGTLCYATGPVGTWDQASSYCSSAYGARLCGVQQWRDAICIEGLPNPGASWTDAITGTFSAVTVSGCTAEHFSSTSAASQRTTTCCAEWPRY